MFKVEIKMMTGEWVGAGKMMKFEGGEWVAPKFHSYDEAYEAFAEVYNPDNYAFCMRIVEVEDDSTPGAFQVGKTYTTRSICNHDCIISITVIKRTAKTIVANCGWKGVKRLRIAEYNGVETVKPWGSYSMAPMIDANDK